MDISKDGVGHYEGSFYLKSTPHGLTTLRIFRTCVCLRLTNDPTAQIIITQLNWRAVADKVEKMDDSPPLYNYAHHVLRVKLGRLEVKWKTLKHNTPLLWKRFAAGKRNIIREGSTILA